MIDMSWVSDHIRKRGSLLWFILLFMLVSSSYEVGRLLHAPPQPHHLWRQTDCISLAWNYYDSTTDLFEPAIHHLFSDDCTTGKTAGEFPLLYYVVGMLWRVAGPDLILYRTIGFLLHLVGSLALFASVRRILGSSFWASCTALLFYASPAIAYFSISFLTDVPAFDLALVGWWFTVRYATERKGWLWAWAMFFFTLGTLLKVTAGMSPLVLAAILAIHTLRARHTGRGWTLFHGNGKEWGALVLGFGAVFAWYAYAAHYNGLHGGKYTFNGLWPLWSMSPEEQARAWRVGSRIVVFQVFDTSAWILLGAAFVLLAAHVRQLPWQLTIAVALLVLGTLLYGLLWFHALDNHDYYFINPMVTLVVILVGGMWWLGKNRTDLLQSPWCRAAMVVLLAFNVGYTAQNLQMRYDTSGAMSRDTLWPIYHEAELQHWNGLGYWNNAGFVHLRPKLRALGIKPSDKVICPDDPTINASLVLIGNRGWTGYGNHYDVGHLRHLIDRGAKYFLFVDPKWLWDPELQPFLNDPLGVIDGVNIYRLHANHGQ